MVREGFRPPPQAGVFRCLLERRYGKKTLSFPVVYRGMGMGRERGKTVGCRNGMGFQGFPVRSERSENKSGNAYPSNKSANMSGGTRNRFFAFITPEVSQKRFFVMAVIDSDFRGYTNDSGGTRSIQIAPPHTDSLFCTRHAASGPGQTEHLSLLWPSSFFDQPGVFCRELSGCLLFFR